MQEILRLQPMEQQLQQLGLQHSGLDCRPPEMRKLMDQKEQWINKKIERTSSSKMSSR